MAYYPVGYPDVPGSLDVLRTLCGEGDEPGADLIEIGLPYSDPVMDGVVIQRAGTRALARGVRTKTCSPPSRRWPPPAPPRW